MLYIQCYRCQGKGHIAINCKFFGEIKGNMKPKRNIKEDKILGRNCNSADKTCNKHDY